MMTAKTGLYCQVRSNLKTEVLLVLAYLVLSLAMCLDKAVWEEREFDIVSGKINFGRHTPGQSILGFQKSHLT